MNDIIVGPRIDFIGASLEGRAATKRSVMQMGACASSTAKSEAQRGVKNGGVSDGRRVLLRLKLPESPLSAEIEVFGGFLASEAAANDNPEVTGE